LLVDGGGVPLALSVDGANRHDMKLVRATLNNLMASRPTRRKQHLCMDKGYDYPTVWALVEFWGYTAHIASRGEPRPHRQKIPKHRNRRWVVERTHSWFNRFRRLLIRWEKKAANYVAMLHLACAFVTLRAAEVMG